MEWDGRYWNGILLDEVDENGDINYPEVKSNLTIEDLPLDCILKILSFLPIRDKFIIENVCQYWREISETGWPSVKRLFIRSTYPRFTTNEIELIFKRCGRFLTSLRIDLEDEKINYLHLILKHCTQIKEFEIDFALIKWRTELSFYYIKYFSRLFEKFPRLESLTILSVKSDFTDESVMNLPEKIQKIRLTVGAHNVHFSVEISRFQTLCCLNLERFIIDENSLNGFEELKNLQELHFSFCNVHISHIEKIKKFKKLEKLWLNGTISDIRDEHLSIIVSSCRNLKNLNLDGLRSLTDRCFKDIAQLPSLQELHMTNLSRITDNAIAHMRTLKSLSCPQCSGIGNDGLKRLIQSAPNLQFISARRTSVNKNFLTDANEAIQNRNNNIKLYLDLGAEAYTWQLPPEFSSLLILEGNVK